MSDFIAGLFGGCAGVLVGHPFDTVKVKLQTQDFRNPLYKGTIDCFRQTITKDGVRGLYRGMASPLVGVGGINAVVFGVQGYCNRLFSNPNDLSSHFLSGMAAGFTQSFICSPVELTKTRLQVQADRGGPAKYKGSMDCLKQIHRAEGVRGLFRGQLCTIFRETPAFGTYFLTFEVLNRLLGDSDPAILAAGGFAGMSSWFISYPVDVVKSRIQSDGAFGARVYTGIVDCIRKSYRQEGFGVFTRGLSSAMVRAFPTNAATFYVVNAVTKVMSQYEDKLDDIENINAIKAILNVGTPILNEVDSIHNYYSGHQAFPRIVATETGNFLPVVVNASKEIWLTWLADLEDRHSGECLEKDTYIGLLSMVRAKKSAFEETAAQVVTRYMTPLCKHHLLSNSI